MFSVSRRLIAILLALIVIAAGSYAAYSIVVIQKSINGTGSINSSPGLSVLDSACSNPLSSLPFSSLGAAKGSTTNLAVCVRNTGNQAFYLDANPTISTLPSVSFSGLPSGVTGTSSLTTPQLLAPEATDVITLTLANDGIATPGPFPFTVTFTGYSTSTG
jgi:hypothetical protein